MKFMKIDIDDLRILLGGDYVRGYRVGVKQLDGKFIFIVKHHSVGEAEEKRLVYLFNFAAT